MVILTKDVHRMVQDRPKSSFLRGGGVQHNFCLSLGGVHVLLRIFRGGQGFAAFGRKFEEPLLWVFLTPSLTCTQE